ncbi:hypothetical protein ILFOPFJJ_04193 [Ensifer psoraleae]|nr:hypothetical protein [Sinorhizobium psoraleae]
MVPNLAPSHGDLRKIGLPARNSGPVLVRFAGLIFAVAVLMTTVHRPAGRSKRGALRDKRRRSTPRLRSLSCGSQTLKAAPISVLV